MRRIFQSVVFVSAVSWLACSRSPEAPSDTPTSGVIAGQTVNAIDGVAVAGVLVQMGRARPVTSDAGGFFQTDAGGPGTYATILTGGGAVERHTMVTGPTSQRLELSLIPQSFDLGAFDQMFRAANARLQRWTSRPSLVVVASVMSYRGNNGTEYAANSEQLSDDEVTQLIAHLSEGLSILTGTTYTTFATVDVERPDSGQRVNMARSGKIVVGRFTGVVSIAETIGFGTWQEQADGTVTGGSMFLDRDFDKNDSRRRLLRIHELGHALGYLHVTTRTSIMNPAIGPEPTEFDRSGGTIAFHRPPGNVTPDTDPSPPSRGFSLGSTRWVRPDCRLR